MADPIRVGDRVRVLLDSDYWGRAGWAEGTVVKIEPYSSHRSFYWVRLDDNTAPVLGGRGPLVSVLNPKKIQPLRQSG